MSAMATIDMLGRLLLYAAAGVGMAVVTMLTVLLIMVLYTVSANSRSRKLAWGTTRTVVRVAITAVFCLVWLYVLFGDRGHSASNTVVFTVFFLGTVVSAWRSYVKLTPELLAVWKHKLHDAQR